MAFEEPEVETWDSLDRIPHPKIRAFAEYWQTKRGGRRAPARGDIDPSDLGSYLPNMYMIDVVQPGPRFKFRLMGTDSQRRTGFDYTGRFNDLVISKWISLLGRSRRGFNPMSGDSV